MSRPALRLLLLLSVLLPLNAAIADADPADPDDLAELRRRLAELEADRVQDRDTIEGLRDEIDALRAENDENWLTEQRAEAIQELVQDVLADADTRANLQAGSGVGYGGKGFFIESADGNYRLNVSGTIQVKFAYNHQRNSPVQPGAVPGDNDRWGFENRRTALRLGGHFMDPSWKYFTQVAVGATGQFGLLDAFVAKDFENGWQVKAGKFKLPFSREQLMSFNTIGLVERSLVANAFGVGRSQGVAVDYSTDAMRITGAFSDGLGSIVGTTAPALAYDTEYALTGRLDWVLWGNFAQFNDFSAWEGEDGLLLGFAVHWEDGEYGTTADETHVIRWTADLSWNLHPFNVFAAVFGNHTTSTTTGAMDQYGVVVQAGWLFDQQKWELFGRWEWADADGGGTPPSDLNIGTIGVARYFKGQNIKWTCDLGYGFDPVSSLFASTPKSWRVDAVDTSDQFVFRSQIQLVF